MTAFSPLIHTQEQQQSIPSAATVNEQLLSYEFPAGFAERLAHEHHWTLAFALEVLREYRRFLVLAATCGQSVTPSTAVDAAWHQHLTHTRDYWLRLTPLLPAPLHHDPSGGLATDTAYFAQQYLKTLDLYRAEFGNANPQIWPDPRLPNSGSPAARKAKRPLPRWLMLAALWLVGGWTVHKFGIWAVAGLALLGIILTTSLFNFSQRRGSSGGSTGDSGGLLGFIGDCDTNADSSGSDTSGDGGSSSCGSGCGSGCGGGCGS